MTPRAELGPEELQRELDLASRVLRAESKAVAGLIAGLGGPFHRAVGLIVACAEAGGTVLVTGLGKSGVIGAKIAATLKSLGVPSHTIHPTEAAHGDLGAFRPSDVCIAISYSGETAEVVALAATLRQDGIPIITITRGGGSGLERLAAASLEIGNVDRIDGVTPAPTCSTTATLALGDALALAAARRRRFTDADFARRHPGGSLGGMVRPVTEVLRFTVGKNLTPAPDDATVKEALEGAETGERRPGALLLIDRKTGRLTGLFTDGDLRRLVLRGGTLATPIGEVMTRNPGTLRDTDLVRDAVAMVREFRRDEIPVVDADGKPVGILDVQDLVTMKVVSE